MTAVIDVGTNEYPFDQDGPGESVYRAITHRLSAEFGAAVPTQIVVDEVQRCRRDLQGSPAGALPELTERLARVRLGLALGSEVDSSLS